MVTMAPGLRQVSKDLTHLVERSTVERLCKAVGHAWRKRPLDPYTTLHLFLLQMIHRNTAMTHLPHLSGERFTASAYCQARQRLPLELIRRRVDAVAKGFEKVRVPSAGHGPADVPALWHGHRLALLDGSGFSMPDAPEHQAHFGQPGRQKPGCGFPVAHLLALFDAQTGFLHDVVLSPLRTHDMKHAADLHPKRSPGDIIVGDRGFCSYAHLARISRANLHAVLRVHPRQIVSFHPHRLCADTIAGKGGRGGMGSLLGRLFGDLGHAVLIADVDTPLTPEEAARSADVIVISVPIGVTEEVIRRLGPHVRAEALLMDVTSIKEPPLRAMMEATAHTGASVVGTHPMFGPGVHSLQGQRVVLCRGRGETWFDWLAKMLSARGLVLTEADPREHDRAMGLVQVLTHFQTQVLGLALSRLGVDLRETLRFTSPAYLMELYVAARHFAQSPRLYGPIEMLNPIRDDVTGAFIAAAQELSGILHRGDQPAFEAMFAEVRRFFGDFTDEALVQSSFLIDRVVERS